MNWIKKNKSELISVMILNIIFLYLFSFTKIEGKIFSFFFLYLSVYIFVIILPERRWLIPIRILIELPATIILILFPFVQIGLILMALVLFSFGILIIILYYVPEYIFNIDLNFASKFYILLIIGSILLTLFGSKIIFYINSILNSNRTEKKEKAQLNLTLTIINKKKIIFTLYSMYFLFLIPYSIFLLSNKNIFEIENLDRSIFNAFITYTAFERILANKNNIKIDIKMFFKKIIDTWK